MSKRISLGCLGILGLSLLLGGCNTVSTPTRNGQTPAAADKPKSDGDKEKDKDSKKDGKEIKPPHHDPDR